MLWLLIIFLFPKPTFLSPIARVTTLFELFNPLSMIRFFEFSDQGWNITENCIKDMYIYLDGIQREALWAIKLNDASAHYSGGFYSGLNARPASINQCRSLDRDALPHSTSQAYFVPNSSVTPFRVSLLNARYEMEVEGAPANKIIVIQTLCMPSSCCGHSDLSQVLSYNQILSWNSIIVKNIKLKDFRIIEGKYLFYKDWNFYLVSCLMILSMLPCCIAWIFGAMAQYFYNEDINQIDELGTLTVPSETSNSFYNTQTTISGTELDVNKLKQLDCFSLESNPKNLHVTNSSHRRNNCSAEKSLDIFLNAFSPIKNMSYLLGNSLSFEQCNEIFERIPTFHGIQFLCTQWILVSQTYAILKTVSSWQETEIQVLTFLADNNSYAMDTFFFLCGCWLSFTLYTSMIHLHTFLQQTIQLFIIVLEKILRQIFSFLIVFIILQIVMKHFRDYSIIEIPSRDHITCPSNLWKNIFYIDTFSPLSERCMVWTWYISTEMQFFIAIAIILLLSSNHSKFGCIICFSFFAGSIITTTLISASGKRSRSNTNIEDLLAYFNNVYDQPWLLIGPYMVGKGLGYLLFKTDCKPHIRLLVGVLGWILSVLIALIIITGQIAFNHLYLWAKTGFAAITHSLWCIILTWFVLISTSPYGGPITKFLSLKCFGPFSKLTKCVLLVHPLVIRVILMSSNSALPLSTATMVTMSIGVIVISYIYALMLYLLFEAPVHSLFKKYCRQIAY